MNVSPRIVGAAFGALAALGVGGVGLAWAQEVAPTTPSTEAPATGDGTPPATPDEDCPEGRDGAAADGASADRIDL